MNLVIPFAQQGYLDELLGWALQILVNLTGGIPPQIRIIVLTRRKDVADDMQIRWPEREMVEIHGCVVCIDDPDFDPKTFGAVVLKTAAINLDIGGAVGLMAVRVYDALSGGKLVILSEEGRMMEVIDEK